LRNHGPCRGDVPRLYSPALQQSLFVPVVYTENLIRVDDVMEPPKLAE
jgi:hypothetical protein